MDTAEQTAPRIVVLDTGYGSYRYEEELLTSHGYRFEVWPGDKADRNGKIEFARNADGAFVRWTVIDDEFLAGAGVRSIARYGVGYENIDVEAATRAGVRVSNVQGYANHAVSDHALALMYGCARGIKIGDRTIRTNYGAPPFERVFEFHEKTLGIVGLGRIGGTLARKAKHLFGRVVACDPYVDTDRFESLGVEPVDLETMLRRSDLISIHCNLTEETTGLLNEQSFNLMSRCPIVVNTARGPVIDEDALLEALDQEKIHSAGIDVYRTEIAEELPSRLLEHPRAITTGHFAWYSERSHVELQKRAADNLLAMLSGEIPEDCLNPDLPAEAMRSNTHHGGNT